MTPNIQDFYLLFCNHNFKNIVDTIQDGFCGMFFVLKIVLDANKELSAGDISQMFNVTTARTAVVLSALEKKGYITKQKSTTDARKTIVNITELGKQILEERKTKLFATLEGFLSKLSQNELQSFYGILKKLLTN